MPRHFLLLLLSACGLWAAEPLVFEQAGTVPVVLSAPHGGTNDVPGVPPRTGAKARQFVALRDSGTAELASGIAAALERELGGRPYVVMARFHRKYIDANRPAADAYEAEAARADYEAYHRALSNASAAVRARWGGGLLVDVHGQSAASNAIFRGTANGLTVTALTNRHGSIALTGPAGLFGQVASRGYAVIPAVAATNREDARYGGGFIVRTYGSHRTGGIDAYQMEFGAALRSRRQREAVAAHTAAAIAACLRTYGPTNPPPAGPGK